MILSTWKVDLIGEHSPLYTTDPVLTLYSIFPEDPRQTQYLPYADAEPRVLESLVRNKCADRVRVFAGEVQESNYEDLYEALHKIKKARPDIKIYLFFNQCIFTSDGYMRYPNTKMLYNCLSQCDTVTEDNMNVFKSQANWEGTSVGDAPSERRFQFGKTPCFSNSSASSAHAERSICYQRCTIIRSAIYEAVA